MIRALGQFLFFPFRLLEKFLLLFIRLVTKLFIKVPVGIIKMILMPIFFLAVIGGLIYLVVYLWFAPGVLVN